ncbi:MAG: sugar phosphate isomerase/epimerase family protein, partial [Chitinophagaceae bacterium]
INRKNNNTLNNELTFISSSFNYKKKNILLSFSTLGCPDWTLQQIVDFAVQHGYKGIEVRGLQRQMDLTKCPEFATEDARRKTMQLMKEKGLQFVGLGSSANMHLPDGEEREKNMAEAKRFIDLAQQIGCPYVRVFPNNFPKEADKKTTVERIAKGLLELGDYAKGKNVTVLMETHGDVIWVDDIETIMQKATHPNVGLVWDVTNMWAFTKEPPNEAYQKLKKYIHHIHVKDAKVDNGKLQYTLLGEGDVPIFEAIDAMMKNGYKGYYSFEWEKLWHPQLPEPEVALGHFPTVIKKHLKGKRDV